jgi:hypothetical protein
LKQQVEALSLDVVVEYMGVGQFLASAEEALPEFNHLVSTRLPEN